MRVRLHHLLTDSAYTDAQVLNELCPVQIPDGVSEDDAAAIQADALSNIALARRLATRIGDEAGETEDAAAQAACRESIFVNFPVYGSRFPAPAAWFEFLDEEPA